MSKDAKLGLVIGIAMVIVIAVVFFRKDQSQAKASTETAAAAVKPKTTVPVVSDMRPPVAVRQHTVVEGESLFSIAERYYGDRTRFVVLYEANRDRLVTPDRLLAGTVVLVP